MYSPQPKNDLETLHAKEINGERRLVVLEYTYGNEGLLQQEKHT